MIPSICIGEKTHQELQQLLRSKHALTISGLSNETAKAMIVSHLLTLHPAPAVLVTENDERTDGLLHWISFFGKDAFRVTFGEEPTADDVSSIVRLMKGDGIAVMDRATWDTEMPSFEELKEHAIILKVGEEVDFTEFFSSLIDAGYEHSDDTHLSPGEYRRVGDTLDVYPVGESRQYKISFSFGKVEEIRAEADDGSEKQKSIIIYPLAWGETRPLGKQFPDTSVLITDEQEDMEQPAGCDFIKLTSFPEDDDVHVHLRYLSVLKFYTLPDFVNDVKDKLQQDWTLVIVSKRADELKGVLTEERIQYLDAPDRQTGRITIVPAGDDELLPHSLQNPDLKCALITDREIFSLRKEAKQRSVQRLALDFITSLQVGDFVVHMEHGIGRFEGMTQKVVDEVEREYLEITYAENDKLFVPVDQADKLSKFVHEEGEEPVLTRLGSSEWKKISKKVSEETQLIAKELLEIYAKRAKAKGNSFPDDSDIQQKFDDAFPYTETPGQIKAIEDIKKDMESGQPMDRLVCGDVGFGKTEVAMRAAFKAVQGGKQVAFLSPITILTDQHYRSLQKRMEGFNVRIDVLSRFRTPQQQAATLEKLREGKVDIIVGTHRLLQDDVQFSDLGLVIIDEEQRFGVKQKEKLKEMRSAVDILTMTATPIPRTLNLGLHKLRDITTITTPPPGRLPIITEVRKYSDALVREAILKEVARGGQVYMLHNRVETIDAFAMKLKALVPQATFVVTHGQLKPDVLEERIVDFKNGKYSVLVSSTIIENGIDLPRANTLIVNEAEKFGLSQLYQLRGRVGRGTVQAYSYFLYHSQRLKDDAKKRLRAIVEASELGSGFQIAMRDLEIRGAGEILGASQSGNMQTVGVSHYLRLLKSAVEELKAGGKGDETDMPQTIEIILPFEALLPSFYIPDEQEKIGAYQKLAGSEDETILAEFEEDLREEYGPLPRQAENLLQVIRLKMACRRAGVIRVKMDNVSATKRDIVVSLSQRVTAVEIMQLLQICPQWRIVGTTLRISEADLKKATGTDDWLPEFTKQIAALIQKKKPKAGKKKEAEA
ncbi:MAG: transcription-repair coupling factor, partial [Candidatus Peribacteraceae bacterium]|nr:transcription-repair coupling factor [Candidatus Peribacteraceae bacterium]